MSLSTSAPDRFTPIYTVLVLAFFLLVVFSDQLDRVFGLYLLIVPLLLVPGGLLLVALLVILTANLVNQHWRRVVSVLLAPVLAAFPVVLGSHLGITPTWLRFQFERAHYERELLQVGQNQGMPCFKTFDWDQTGGAGSGTVLYTLVYDCSDEIAELPDRRSPEWIEQARKEPRLQALFSTGQGLSVQSLGHHFYEVAEAF